MSGQQVILVAGFPTMTKSYTDELAFKKVRKVAEQTKQPYDCKAHATQLIIGE